MFQGANRAGAERHHHFVNALVRRADGLQLRAEASTADHIRRAESLRAASIGHDRAIAAFDELIAATEKMRDALAHLHHMIVRVADEAPQWTRWERWLVRRMLKKSVRQMEKGVLSLENRR
jgi:hypothetical protein